MNLRQLIEYTLIILAAIVSFTLVINYMPKKGDTVRIDCSISEISPDFTTEMKEACRQLRARNN